MADSLCGPSNALSTFQKHSTVDRTLQQDRLALQPSREQGFRSAPGPNAGILDAEFEAFQASPPAQFHHGFQEHQNVFNTSAGHGFPHGFQRLSPQILNGNDGRHAFDASPEPRPPPKFQPVQPQFPGWASDFQNMDLNEMQPSQKPASPFPESRSLEPNASHWHLGGNQQRPAARYGDDPSMIPGHTLLNIFEQRQAASNLSVQTSAYNHSQKQEQSQDIDDTLFEKHFEAAALHMDQIMVEAEANLKSLKDDTLEEAKLQQAFDNATLLNPSIIKDHHNEPIIDASPQDPIGSDRILPDSDTESLSTQDGADELARAAGDLLEKVKHDQSEKFKQSVFLSLMRQLRDQEVRVEGDKLVDVSIPSSSPLS